MGLRSGRRGRRALRGWSGAAALAAVLGLALLPGAATPPVRAQGLPARGGAPPGLAQTPVLLTANEITYDQDLDIVTATGSVEISQNDRVLHADTVSYNRRAEVVTASGNVTLLEPSGDVVFADHIELSSGFRDGVAQNLRMMLADQSRIAAVSARRAGGRITVLRQSVYSPCELCQRDPHRAPLWQIRADRTIYDQDEHRVYHNDAQLELFGVPVLWTPYIYHPDGQARRQSGFLVPEFRTSSQLGAGITLPYYLVLGPSADLTIAPAFYTQDLPLISGEYRQRLDSGAVRVNASVTNSRRVDDSGNVVPGRETRWHVGGGGQFDIDDDWRATFDLGRASDKTYLQHYRLGRRYQLEDTNTLTSDARVERFDDRSYTTAEVYAFQGLRPQDDDGLAPLVAPWLRHSWSSEPLFGGSRVAFDADTLSIWRRSGTRTNRLAFSGSWTLPHVFDGGQVVTLATNVRGEFYHADNLGNPNEDFQPTEAGNHARMLPQVSLTASWPFVRRGQDYRIIVEPTVQIVAAPFLGNQAQFPNEDSRGVDFDDTNLFRTNRFTGLDRLESGQRASYGIKLDAWRPASLTRVSAFIGQSYRFNRSTDFPDNTGLETHLSNIVGRLTATYADLLVATYQFQLDGNSFTRRRQSLGVTIGPPAVRLSASYIFIDKNTQTNLTADISQVSLVADVRLTENWRVQGRHVRDVGNSTPGSLLTGAALIYEDECFVIATDVTRRNTGTADNPPDTSIVVRLIFKNFGDFSSRL
jgi:LPS-assembly protein